MERLGRSAAGTAALQLRALTAGQDYYVAIESFNETGVSKPSAAVYLP